MNTKESGEILPLTYLLNSQSIEYAVKPVTEASKLVYGLKKSLKIFTKDQSKIDNHRNVNKTNYFIPNK